MLWGWKKSSFWIGTLGLRSYISGWHIQFLVAKYRKIVCTPRDLTDYQFGTVGSWWKFMEITTSMSIGFCMFFYACTFRFFSVGRARHSERALDGLLPPFDGGSGWNQNANWRWWLVFLGEGQIEVETTLTTSVTFKGNNCWRGSSHRKIFRQQIPFWTF